MGKCNGWRTDRVRFTEEACGVIRRFLPELRIKFENENKDKIGFGGTYVLGWRFKDDKDIIVTLESAVSEEEFLKNPEVWIMDALSNCADRDYWYTYEKQWE